MYHFGNLTARPGQFITLNIFGQPRRVSNIITSWATKIARVENDGTLTPIN